MSGEVQVEPGMFVQPLADVLVFVGGVVVADQVDRQIFGNLTIDGLEELQPLLMPMARHTLPDHHAGQHVQSAWTDYQFGSSPHTRGAHTASARIPPASGDHPPIRGEHQLTFFTVTGPDHPRIRGEHTDFAHHERS